MGEHARSEGARDWRGEWSAARSANRLPALLAELRAAARTDPGAMSYLATLYREGVEGRGGAVLVRRSPRRSLAYARRAAAAGDHDGLLEVANHLDGVEDGASTRRARQIYRRLARRGDGTAMFNLAVSYQRDQRHPLAIKWFRAAAAQGYRSARIELAKARYFGTGVRRQPRAALAELVAISSRWEIDISPFDREQCLVFVARALLDGWGVPRDPAKARSHLQAAAKLGSETAAAMLREWW